jgi:hypothetical protein
MLGIVPQLCHDDFSHLSSYHSALYSQGTDPHKITHKINLEDNKGLTASHWNNRNNLHRSSIDKNKWEMALPLAVQLSVSCQATYLHDSIHFVCTHM